MTVMKRLILLLSTLALGVVLQAGPSSAVSLGIQVDPVASSVRVGGFLYVTGTAPLLRTVVLQILRGGVWTTISSPSGSGARFAFRVPTYYDGTRVLRVTAPQGLLGEIDSATITVHVRPTYTPAGTAGQHKLVGNGYRWNPCAPIRYHVDYAGVRSGNLELIRQALTRVRAATGLSFVYAGRSTRVPFSDSWYARTPTSGLYFAWSTPAQVPAIRGLVGLGGESRLVDTAAGSHVITTGGVLLARSAWPHMRSGWHNGIDRGSLLLHEIGHAMGLMHVTSKTEIMHPSLGGWTRPRYGAGDLAGLERLGMDQGCLP
ncbi:MAG: matrixin family metalloprotease [Nocardioidaceae bacterium]|nr:matrixin family metalloprotease [Nocardioidaceae bacterium]